jgi:exodeoxyribonuclease VII small subunit
MGSKKKEGFEELYGRLEETVGRLEEGGLTLDESIALYEEGMKLAQRCQEMLEKAELRVTRLQESFAESLGALREEAQEYAPPDEEVSLPPGETPLE